MNLAPRPRWNRGRARVGSWDASLAWRWVGTVLVLTLALTLPLALRSEPRDDRGTGRATDKVLFAPRFATSGLVTNELAYRHPHRPGVRLSPDWVVTSGSLFADRGAGWSGVVDDVSPGIDSRHATNSAVLRAVSRRTDLRDVSVRLRLVVDRLTETESTGRRDFDGVHLMLRYRDADHLYYLSVCRRDGVVAIKKKAAPGAGPARYTTLAQGRWPCRHRVWRTAQVEVRNTPRGVALSLEVGGRRVLTALDRGQDGTAPLTGAGRVGIRGDNAELHLRDLVVRSLR